MSKRGDGMAVHDRLGPCFSGSIWIPVGLLALAIVIALVVAMAH